MPVSDLTENLDLDSEITLLAVTGMSPAILTETIWALAIQTPPLIPHRIRVVTTTIGREVMVQRLFSPLPLLRGETPWNALRTALALLGHDLTGKLLFGTTADDIRVMTHSDAGGLTKELPDLRTEAENAAAADFILEQVRAITANPDTTLIASIAGGRKTMGALLYACMTLAARESDLLTHVLVSEPYETLPDFFFPGQPSETLPHCDGANYAPQQAQLELAQVPFIPLRNLFQRELGRAAGTFTTLIRTCTESIRKHNAADLRVQIHYHRPTLLLNHYSVDLSPREHAMLLVFAERAKQDLPSLPSFKDSVDAFNDGLTTLQQRFPSSELLLSYGFINDDTDLRRAIFSLKNKIKHLGPAGLAFADSLPARKQIMLAIPGPMIHLA